MSIFTTQENKHNTVDKTGFLYDFKDVFVNYPKIDKLYAYEAQLPNNKKAPTKMQRSIQIILTKEHLEEFGIALQKHYHDNNLPPLTNLDELAIRSNASMVREGEKITDLDIRYQNTFRKTISSNFDVDVKRWHKGRFILLESEQIATEVYAGCRCIVGVQVKYYYIDHKSKGYSFYLKGVIKIGEGEPFPVSVASNYGQGLDMSKYEGTPAVAKQYGEVEIPSDMPVDNVDSTQTEAKTDAEKYAAILSS